MVLSEDGDHPMAKLSDTQAVILSAASQRDDGAVLPPDWAQVRPPFVPLPVKKLVPVTLPKQDVPEYGTRTSP